MPAPTEELVYDRHPSFDRIKTVNVPPLPADIVNGLKPYELSALGFDVADFELLDEAALAAGKKPRLIYRHRPPTEQMAQMYSVANTEDTSPERLTYFSTGGGRTLASWDPVIGDNLRGQFRKGGAIVGMDLDGDEVFQLWRYWEDEVGVDPIPLSELELDNKPGKGRIERLTNDGYKYLNPLISKQGRGTLLAFGSNMENNKDTKVYMVDLSKPGWNLVKVFDNPFGASYPSSFSSDERYLIVMRTLASTNIERYIVDLQDLSATPKKIVLPGIDPNEKVAIKAAHFLRQPGSIEILIGTDAYGDFTSILLYDLATGAARHLTTPDPSLKAIFPIPWDVVPKVLSRNYALFAANRDGYCDLYRYDFQTKEMKPILLPGHTGDILTEAICDGANGSPNNLVVQLTSSHFASILAAVDLSDPDKPIVTPYTSCQSGKPSYPTSDPQLIRYKSFDGLSIPALVYLPPKPKTSDKLPCVISIHGGPSIQVRPSFRVSLNAYVVNELGVALIAPNVRGSSGYGKTYEKADDVFKREDSVKDIGALLEYIRTSMPEIDSSRIAIMGGSYGGYMTFACLFHYSPLIRCGVATCGISNWVTFLESTHPARRAHRRNEYGDESDPKVRAFLESIAPANHIDEINVPLYISQGEKDSRVPLSEALNMFNTVRAKGLDTWLVVGEQEGHQFKQKSCIEFVNASKATFLKKWLLGDEQIAGVQSSL